MTEPKMPTTSVTSGPPQSGLVVSSGTTLDVQSGGTIVSASILAAGAAIIEIGAIDSGSTIAAGGSELVYGSVIGDIVAGSQTVSTGTSGSGIITDETVVDGGYVLLAVKTTSATGTTVDAGGTLALNGSISANDTVLSGGTVDLESAKATLTGALVFSGGGVLEVTGNTSAGSGDLAVISGFGAGAEIDLTAATTVGAVGSAARFTTATSAGNTTVTVSGGGATQSFIFSGTAIGANLFLVGDGSGGEALVSASSVTSVGSGPPQSNIVVVSGETLTVHSGGSIVHATVEAGGSAVILSGGVDSASTVLSGGFESVSGTTSGDSLYGSQTISGAGASASGETVYSGGVLSLGSGATATDIVISGGTVALASPQATLSGSLIFSGSGTLQIDAPSSAGYGDQAVISGFYTSDTVSLPGFGSGTTLSTTTSGGDTIATVTSGTASETLTFAGDIAANLTPTSGGPGGSEDITYVPTTVPTTTSYTPGDLVLSIYGDGADTGSYSLDQAAPIVLQEITPTGTVVSQLVLPQTTVTVNGVTEYAISGEYQSASEGLLTLAENGQSLAIMGYGVTATAFDAADAATVYGTTALGQTTSLTGSSVTAVPRVIADIGYNATIDTSTALYNIFDTNNPRSVVTVNGVTFYVSGQGNGTDGTEGVFMAEDGASSATPIYNSTTDTRDVEIANGQLYVSIDSKLNNGGGLYDFGATLPISATAPTELPGIGASVVLTAGTANSVNAADIGQSVNLSPEQYFFADADTLYVADGGDPKEGGLGDGGLQKWSLVDGSWVLDYTLSEGLNQIPDTDASGTTGLIGLTGTVEGANVILYATNETVAETDQTYLYGITDSLGATSLPTGESFTLLETAAPDTLIRGVAFAPTSSSTLPEVSGTLTISKNVTSTGLTVASGGDIIVLSGGTISNTTLLSGASATVSSGGVDDGTMVAHGGNELLLGSATGDYIVGTQTISNATAVASGEIVGNGGNLDLYLAGAIANSTTVETGGAININGHAFADNTVISGGQVVLESPKATLSGTLTFAGTGGMIVVTSSITSAGYGDLAVISGFAATDAIDERVIGAGAVLGTPTLSGGNTVATISSGTVTESFTFAGSAYLSGLSLTSDGFGGEELIYTPPPPVQIIVSSGVTSPGLSATSGSTIIVLSGGTITNAVISSGGSAVISAGGTDSGTTIQAGGTETVSGSASGDRVYGLQDVTTGPSAGADPATISNETVFNGGTIELYLKPDTGTGITVSSGGKYLLSGNVSATDTVLEAGAQMQLQSPKATLTGSLTFNGAAALSFTATTSAGFGDLAVIDGFGAGDIIDETTIAPGATLSATISGGNTVETITGGTFPESFIFAGTTISSNIQLQDDGTTGVELVYVACFRAGTRIATADGDVAVEALSEGDLVRTAAGAARPVVWIGHRTIDCARHPAPRMVWPVRVAKGAFADAQPCRDLYLSPDHAVFVDGLLVPIRQLLNGVSIAQIAVDTVAYFHVELETHDVLLAEGLPAETYLDSGNRGDFANGGGAMTLHPMPDAAPRAVDGDLVEPIWRRIAARAGALVLPVATTEAALRLVADGRAHKPVCVAGGRHVFVVPPGLEKLRILSRASAPADLRPWLDDRRLLGVSVARIVLHDRHGATEMPLDHPALADGWHAPERDGDALWRWTDGSAVLPVPAGTTMVDIALTGTAEYPAAVARDAVAERLYA
jgi:autotransporter passenger strand-loop-strand repeat protein